jgi:hypothetical protein|tara:strand:+ start:2728 stop:2901 length:174 start_codon:yes stop_codon:yes gene_type:complete
MGALWSVRKALVGGAAGCFAFELFMQIAEKWVRLDLHLDTLLTGVIVAGLVYITPNR